MKLFVRRTTTTISSLSGSLGPCEQWRAGELRRCRGAGLGMELTRTTWQVLEEANSQERREGARCMTLSKHIMQACICRESVSEINAGFVPGKNHHGILHGILRGYSSKYTFWITWNPLRSSLKSTVCGLIRIVYIACSISRPVRPCHATSTFNIDSTLLTRFESAFPSFATCF